jgi:hypothetical protein
MDLLSYFTEIWFISRAFDEAQEKGDIPYDESFDPSFILSDGKNKHRFPYWLSLDVQNEIQKMKKNGQLYSHFPSHWTGVDEEGNHRCLAWIQASKSHFLVTHTGMREQLFPIDTSDFLCQISVFDIRKMIGEYFATGKNTLTLNELDRELKRYKAKYKMRSFGGSGEFA